VLRESGPTRAGLLIKDVRLTGVISSCLFGVTRGDLVFLGVFCFGVAFLICFDKFNFVEFFPPSCSLFDLLSSGEESYQGLIEGARLSNSRACNFSWLFSTYVSR